jgi:5'-nucleotidase/UDP-sugar diphosphatase
MRKNLFLIFCLLIGARTYAQTEKKLIILHTNDMHSRLTGFGPESAYTPLSINDDNTVGGFARIATVIRQEKEKSPSNTIAADAGDFLMGTLFQALEAKTGFQLHLMKKMGYDIACLGNHEFDFGPEKLGEILKSAINRGEIPKMLTGNAVFNPEDQRDDLLEELFNNKSISRTAVLNIDGLKVGFFSLMGADAVVVAPKSAPVKFEKQTSFARRMVKELKNENCDIIICLSHSGVEKDKDGTWDGEDVELAENVKGINLIIGGHTHTQLDAPIMVNGIPIVQAGDNGRFVGRLALSWNGSGLTVEDYKLLSVDDKIPGDKEINDLVENQKNLISDEILKPLGMSYEKPIAESGFQLECNEYGDITGSNLGPLVADAIQYYVNNHIPSGTDLSMVAVGVIREKILPGKICAPDIFRVMSLGSGRDDVPGYPLSRLYITGRELKNVLEILQVAYKSTPGNYCYFSGIRVEYNPEKGMLRKISNIEIIKGDGKKTTVDFSKSNKTLYSLTANSYMLEFIGIIKKKSFGLINVVPKDSEGRKVTDMKTAVIDFDDKANGVQEGKEWLALAEYMMNMKDTNGDGIPDVDRRYAVPVRSFVEIK